MFFYELSFDGVWIVAAIYEPMTLLLVSENSEEKRG
jgi:hypothetical protein